MKVLEEITSRRAIGASKKAREIFLFNILLDEGPRNSELQSTLRVK